MNAPLLDEFLAWLQQEYQIVLFADMADRTKNIASTRKPTAVLTFDDGYKDFIESVAPILEKRSIAVNQNIIPTCVETGRPPINVELQDFVAAAPKRLLQETPLPGLPTGADPDRRTASCLILSRAVKWQPIARQKAIYAELLPKISRFDGFKPTPMMNPDEIRQIAARHTVGAHSYEHASMNVESDEYLREDVHRCRAYLKEKCGVEPRVYAFPNGAFRRGQEKIVRSAGFDWVLGTGERLASGDDTPISRLTMYGDTLAELRFRALGGVPRLRNARDIGG